LKTNYHSHSNFCDGSGTLEDYIKSALERNFSALGFSGHAPLPFENDWAIPGIKLDNYLEEIIHLKKKYEGKIVIKSGLEIDYLENLSGPSSQCFKDLKLDYIIASVHLLKDNNSEQYLAVDYTKSEIEKLIIESFHGDAKLLVKEYYSKIRKMVDEGGFDIIGHLDVVKKTNIDSIYFDETESWYKDEIEKTLDYISGSSKILEINTGNIIHDESRIYPSPWILKRARQYNIPIMLNSDAHKPERIENYFKEAKAIISDAGYTELKVLKENKWINDIIV
jgi:histidinol-phosphatase (PHP family)